MATGFILITAAPAKEHDIREALLKVKEVVYVNTLFGEYDMIAKLEAEDYNILGQVVEKKVRTIPGIIGTKQLNCLVF